MGLGLFEEVKHKEIIEGNFELIVKGLLKEKLEKALFSLDGLELELKSGTTITLGFDDSGMSFEENIDEGTTKIKITQRSLTKDFDKNNEIKYEDLKFDDLLESKIVELNIYHELTNDFVAEVTVADIFSNDDRKISLKVEGVF